jgi:pimeloyl-ACP methyl ester carboxylesterase
MEHRLVEVPGGRIHLVEHGSGPLVLLVHGFPESYALRLRRFTSERGQE